MHTATDLQSDRRAAIVKLLREQAVGRQAELVRLLRKEGHEATQSSVSRDLRDLGVLKAGDRYLIPEDAGGRVNSDFDRLAAFVRAILPAGPSITVIKTTVGAAQSIAAALDSADWPEVIGTISGDDTIFVATENARQQRKVLERLRILFRV